MNTSYYSNRFAQLVIFDKTKQIKTVLMNQPQVTIGRNKIGNNCDILLESEVVSTKHGIFNYYNGEFYYTDGINANGTYINGVKIPKAEGRVSAAQKLRDGDILTVGMNSVSGNKTVYILFSTSVSNDYVWHACSLETMSANIRIGRDASSDIVISEASVSRNHATITKAPNGDVYITDCKSANGTILDGMLMRQGSTALFKELGVVTIGTTKLINFQTAIVYCVAKSMYHGDASANLPWSNGSVFIENKDVYNVGGGMQQTPSNGGISGGGRRGGVELRAENLTRIVPCKRGTGINGGDKKYILQDVSLTIYPGELVAILGGSGAGKTTLMNAINGFEPASSGTVYFNGNDLYRNYQAYKAQIGYVPQQDIVYDNLTVFDMLAYVAKLRLPKDITKDEITHRVDDVLRAMALEKQRDTLIKKLSGGQRKRASIGVEMISDPSLFFLDEPTSGLDPEAETNLMKQLQMLSQQRGKTIIVITHTLQNIHLFDKVIFMAPGGSLCFYGSPEDAKRFFEVDNLSDAYEKISLDVDKYVNKFRAQRY